MSGQSDRPVRYLHDAQLKPEAGLQSPQAALVFKAFEANVENCFTVLSELHFGQLTFAVAEKTSSSNLSPHSKQIYSNNGISFHLCCPNSRTGYHT